MDGAPEQEAEKPKGISRLWWPPASITGPSERRRARVTLALLLALLALGGLDLVANVGVAYGELDHDAALEALAVMGIALSYALARKGKVATGVVLVIVVIQALIWHFRTEAAPGAAGATLVYALAIPILLAGLLLPPRPALAMAGLTIATAVLGELYLDGGPPTGALQGFGLFLFLAAVAVLSIAASALNERDARELHEATQLLKQVTDNIPEVFFVVAADHSRSYYGSPAYETMWGRPVAGYLADPLDWLKGVHPEDLPRVQAFLADRRQGPLEFRIVHPSGIVRHVRSRTFPVLDGQGAVVRIVGLAEDITAARQAQEQLREAQRQRIHLMQQLAHDMASPLTPVKLQVRLLAAGGDAKAQRGMDLIRRNVDHLERLVADVRDIARLEGGDLKLVRRPVDVADLARQAVDSLAPAAAERKVRLLLDAKEAAVVDADSGRITQVLYNLVGNAMKFTPPDGQVTVAVTTTPGAVAVAVQDTGSGMGPEQLARLFKPFSQVHDPSVLNRPEDKGSGLGLYISKGLVEAHGGTIAVASDGPGTGSTFTFRLPLAPPAHGPV